MTTDLDKARRQRAIRQLSAAVRIVTANATIDERIQLERMIRLVALDLMPISDARAIVADLRRTLQRDQQDRAA